MDINGNVFKNGPYQDINSVPTAGSVAGSLAKEAMNPVNWPAMFPNALDINNGVSIPIISKYDLSPSSIKKAFGKSARFWGRTKSITRTPLAFRKSLMRTEEVRYGNGRFSTYKKAREMYDTLKSEYDRLDRNRKLHLTKIPKRQHLYQQNFNIQYRGIRKMFDIRVALRDPDQLIKMFPGDKEAKKVAENLSKSGKRLTGTYLRNTRLMRMGMRLAKWGSRGVLALSVASLGYMVGEPIGRSIVQGFTDVVNNFHNRFMPEMTGSRLQEGYLTRGAATERQRAIEALSKSSLNGRSAFGQEANFFHM